MSQTIGLSINEGIFGPYGHHINSRAFNIHHATRISVEHSVHAYTARFTMPLELYHLHLSQSERIVWLLEEMGLREKLEIDLSVL